jgi:hypothetical protein
MTGHQLREVLSAFAACDPASGAEALLPGVSETTPAGSLELAVRGGPSSSVKLVARPVASSKRRRFSTKVFEEPVASALAVFHGLCEIAAVESSAKGGWTLILAEPVPWPLFLRTDLSAPFVPRAAQLSLLLRDLRVTALDFDGEALWARFVS